MSTQVVDIYQEAKEKVEKILGDNNASTAQMINFLITIYLEGRSDGLEQARQIHNDTYGK